MCTKIQKLIILNLFSKLNFLGCYMPRATRGGGIVCLMKKLKPMVQVKLVEN